MAHHQSAIKRIRQSEDRRVLNKYFARTTRSAIRTLQLIENKEEAKAELPKVTSMVDKLAKKNLIHKSKASNIKSKLTKHVNGLA